jgi:hypothetical protein
LEKVRALPKRGYIKSTSKASQEILTYFIMNEALTQGYSHQCKEFFNRLIL